MIPEYDVWHRRLDEFESDQVSRSPAIWYQMVLERLPCLDGLRVAEVGCGRGDFTILLGKEGARVNSLDVSASAIDIARQRAAGLEYPVEFFVSDAQDCALRSNTFDLVVSCEVLEHVEHPRRMLDELFRICKPGGRVILTTPSYLNGQLIAWIHHWITRRPLNTGAGIQPRENFFVFFYVRWMIKRAGFRVEATNSAYFRFLLLPRVDPARFTVPRFSSRIVNRMFRPFGMHYLFDLRKPS